MECCDAVLVFVTREYVRRVQQHGDSLRCEFLKAAKTPEKLVMIRLDSTPPLEWSGPLRMIVRSSLYVVDLSMGSDDDVARLIQSIHSCNPTTLWKANFKRRDPVRRVRPSAMRGRVRRIVAAMGDRMTDEDHVGDVVHRLFWSVVGEAAPTDRLVDRVSRLEEELGLV